MRKRRISCEADMMEAEVENRSGGGGWGSDNTVFMEQTNYRMEEADTEPVRLVPVETGAGGDCTVADGGGIQKETRLGPYGGGCSLQCY